MHINLKQFRLRPLHLVFSFLLLAPVATMALELEMQHTPVLWSVKAVTTSGDYKSCSSLNIVGTVDAVPSLSIRDGGPADLGRLPGSAHEQSASILRADALFDWAPPVRSQASSRVAAENSGDTLVLASPPEVLPGRFSRKAKLLSQSIAKQFRVSEQHAERVVRAAIQTAGELNFPPTLLLAVIAVESGFVVTANNSGARGLMQIIPRWHKDTVAAIGGPSELLKVESNVWAGGQILREYVDKAGSIPKGLVRYNASVNAAHYSQKVLLQKRGFEQMLADL